MREYIFDMMLVNLQSIRWSIRERNPYKNSVNELKKKIGELNSSQNNTETILELFAFQFCLLHSNIGSLRTQFLAYLMGQVNIIL